METVTIVTMKNIREEQPRSSSEIFLDSSIFISSSLLERDRLDPFRLPDVCYLIRQRGGEHAHELPLRSQPPHLLPPQLPQTIQEEENDPWRGRSEVSGESVVSPWRKVCVRVRVCVFHRKTALAH